MRHHLLLLLVLAGSCGARLPGARSRSHRSGRASARGGPRAHRLSHQVRQRDRRLHRRRASPGLAEGTELILKQKTSLSDQQAAATTIEPGVVARLKVISVASTSAVCEVVASKRELAEGDDSFTTRYRGEEDRRQGCGGKHPPIPDGHQLQRRRSHGRGSARHRSAPAASRSQ